MARLRDDLIHHPDFVAWVARRHAKSPWRNTEMAQAILAGETIGEIAQRLGVTRGRVSGAWVKIVRTYERLVHLGQVYADADAQTYPSEWDFIQSCLHSHKHLDKARADMLEVSVRTANAIKFEGLKTVQDVIDHPDWSRIPNFGVKSTRELVEVLGGYGLKLKGKTLQC